MTERDPAHAARLAQLLIECEAALGFVVTEEGAHERAQWLQSRVRVLPEGGPEPSDLEAARRALEPFAKAAAFDRVVHVCGAPADAELLADNTLGLEVTVGD